MRFRIPGRKERGLFAWAQSEPVKRGGFRVLGVETGGREGLSKSRLIQQGFRGSRDGVRPEQSVRFPGLVEIVPSVPHPTQVSGRGAGEVQLGAGIEEMLEGQAGLLRPGERREQGEKQEPGEPAANRKQRERSEGRIRIGRVDTRRVSSICALASISCRAPPVQTHSPTAPQEPSPPDLPGETRGGECECNRRCARRIGGRFRRRV